MEVVILSYKSTNCYLIKSNCGCIMIDAGWPDTLPQILRLLKQNDINLRDIKYLFITHFHPDHGGLAQNLKDFGVEMVLHESQIGFVDKLNAFFRKNPKFSFKAIETGNNKIVSSPESRVFLETLGIKGEILHTPGHSDDSISLVIDECCAFTGDLPELSLVEAYDDETLKVSWKLIQDYKVKKIYPAHGGQYTL